MVVHHVGEDDGGAVRRFRHPRPLPRLELFDVGLHCLRGGERHAPHQHTRKPLCLEPVRDAVLEGGRLSPDKRQVRNLRSEEVFVEVEPVGLHTERVLGSLVEKGVSGGESCRADDDVARHLTPGRQHHARLRHLRHRAPGGGDFALGDHVGKLRRLQLRNVVEVGHEVLFRLEVVVVVALCGENHAEQPKHAAHDRREQGVRELGAPSSVRPRALARLDERLPEAAHEDPLRRDEAQDRRGGDPVWLAVDELGAGASLGGDFGDIHCRLAAANHHHALALDCVFREELR
mmetsp:Transcript_24833/g.49610  ORF Transcript_24833/g.49610 Transcript_24833/m.49610 type:complete len:290 (-) Transcript_24833:589-1458(-)